MRILICGAGGMIGSAATAYLIAEGHEVIRLVRREAGLGEVRWDPDAGAIDADGLERFDGVVHVASLPATRWTSDYIKRWRANRIGTNRLLAETLARRKHRPRVLICASGQGVYPSGEEILTEDAAIAKNYLAELLCEGEAATGAASAAGIRVHHLRLPMVVGGSSLRTFMANPRVMGNGRQWWSWLARDDVCHIIEHLLSEEVPAGPINVTSPNPLRNADCTAALARIAGRRPGFAIPAFVLRLLFGRAADALVLSSRRMEPRRLLDSGYQFRHPDFESAVRYELAQVGV